MSEQDSGFEHNERGISHVPLRAATRGMDFNARVRARESPKSYFQKRKLNTCVVDYVALDEKDVTQFLTECRSAVDQKEQMTGLIPLIHSHLKHQHAHLVEMDRSWRARYFTRKIFLSRTVSDGKNYAPVTMLLERNAAMTRLLIIFQHLPSCEFLIAKPNKLTPLLFGY